jgi:hypothetical protein
MDETELRVRPEGLFLQGLFSRDEEEAECQDKGS